MMSVKTDTIEERTAAAGVTIDGLLLKDGGLPNLPGAGLDADQTAALVAYEAALAAATAGQVLTASEPGVAAFADASAGGASEIIYAAKLQGSAGVVPTITLLKNNTGTTITASRIAGGFYNLNSSGTPFDTGTTAIQATILSSGIQLVPSVVNAAQLLISAYTLAGAPNDGISALIVVLDFP